MNWRYGVMASEHSIPINFKKRLKKAGLPTKNKVYGIHEVYYDCNEKPTSWTSKPEITADSIDGLRWKLKEMLKALDRPIIKKPKKK